MSKVGIIGAGPAGLSCALWLKNLAFNPILIERAGKPAEVVAKHHHPNNWLLGFGNIPGGEIRDRMVSHVAQQKINTLTGTTVTGVAHKSRGFVLELDHLNIEVDFLVIATGASPTCPPALLDLSQKFPAAIQIGPENPNYLALHKKNVAILGGGDNAFEHACLLADQDNQVTIFSRSPPRTRADFLKTAETHPNITIYTHCRTSNFDVINNLVTFQSNGKPQQMDYLMVMYGFTPNTQWIDHAAPWMTCLLNDGGFIQTDSHQRTPIPFVYAIGDVTSFQTPCIPVAVAQGAVAAKSIEFDSRNVHE